MFHEPAKPVRDDPAFGYKRRMGLWMFLGYGILYSVFIGINLIAPSLMGRVLVSGLDLAVVYGFGLILAAIALALLYNALCTRREKRTGGFAGAAAPRGRAAPREGGASEGRG